MNTPNPTPLSNIIVLSVDHNTQRYDTIGDWAIKPLLGDDNSLAVRVSKLPDWRMGAVCAVHEIVEALICHQNGVLEEAVSAFDVMYEHARPEKDGTTKYALAKVALLIGFGCDCDITADSEPGEDVHAPYHKEHMVADGIERTLAAVLGLDWEDYCVAVENLEYNPQQVAKKGENHEAR